MEVIVSAMLFLMLMAVLQGAVTFSSTAQDKSRKLRKDYAAMFQKLQETDVTDAGAGNYRFYAYDTDETTAGNQVFTIDAELGKKDVSYETTDGETKTAHFYLFHGGETHP